MAALLLATVDFLRDEAGLSADECDLSMDGMPQPPCGNRFVAVHFGYERDNGSHGESLDKTYGVSVTVTMRSASMSPRKAVREILTGLDKVKPGVLALMDRIETLLHQDPISEIRADAGLRARANKFIGTVTANGFIVPLETLDKGMPRWQNAAWFGEAGNNPYAGISQTARFGNATRVQKIEEQT